MRLTQGLLHEFHEFKYYECGLSYRYAHKHL